MSKCFATTGSQPKKSQLGNQLNTVLFILARSAELCAILSEIIPFEKIRLCFQRKKRLSLGKILAKFRSLRKNHYAKPVALKQSIHQRH